MEIDTLVRCPSCKSHDTVSHISNVYAPTLSAQYSYRCDYCYTYFNQAVYTIVKDGNSMHLIDIEDMPEFYKRIVTDEPIADLVIESVHDLSQLRFMQYNLHKLHGK